MTRMCILFALAAVGLARADLATVKQEPNLEKRSELALIYADTAIDEAKKVYEQNPKEFAARVGEVREAVELSYTSLQDSGKRARRSPKYFKRAEHRLRALVKRLEGLEQQVGIEDREPVVDTKKRVNDLHEQVLLDIMSKK